VERGEGNFMRVIILLDTVLLLTGGSIRSNGLAGQGNIGHKKGGVQLSAISNQQKKL